MKNEILKFNSDARIKEIKHKFDSVVVYVDKGNFSLYNDVFSIFKMKEGETYDSYFLNEAIEKNNIEKIKNYVKNLQAKSMLNEFYIRKKIDSKFNLIPYKTKHIAISLLKEEKIIDDLKFAKDVYEYFNEKNYGRLKIEKYLYDKHIKEEVITKLKFNEDNELKKAKNYLKSINLKIKNISDEVKYYKLKNLLLRQGFELSIISNLLDF